MTAGGMTTKMVEVEELSSVAETTLTIEFMSTFHDTHIIQHYFSLIKSVTAESIL